jgi:hypothetical protein
MLARLRATEVEWWLLGGVVVLMIALLGMHEYTVHQPQAPPRASPTANVMPAISSFGPVYRVDQVMAGWRQHPNQWVGRTILVRAQSYSSCVASSSPYYDTTIPCVEYNYKQIVPWRMLYDTATRAEIPAIDRPNRQSILTDPELGSSFNHPGVLDIPLPAILRVTLVTRRDCGPLGKGQHPCLLATGALYVGR